MGNGGERGVRKQGDGPRSEPMQFTHVTCTSAGVCVCFHMVSIQEQFYSVLSAFLGCGSKTSGYFRIECPGGFLDQALCNP